MKNPDEIPFSEILAELLDPENPFLPSRLFRLSQLDEPSSAALAAVWPQIPLDRRRNLLSDMESFAADDPLLFFDGVAVIAVRDTDAEVRGIAVRLLALEEEPEFAQILVSVVSTDDHFDVRAAAATALGKFVYLGEIEELPRATYKNIENVLLKAHREDPQVIVRRRALEAIGFSSRPEVGSLIEDAFNSSDEDWQVSALFAMGASADKRWEKSVLSMLDSDSSLLRYQAVRAAGKLDLKETKPVLFDIAENDEDEDVRAVAIWALTDIGGEEVAEFIEALLDATEDDAEIAYLEDALDNLMDSEMFNEMELPLFDFDEADLLDMSEILPDDEGDE